MALKTIFNIDISARQTNNAEGARDVADRGIQHILTMASGTTAGKADLMFYDERTIAGGGNEVLDLAGSLSDAFGATLTFVNIKAIVIQNRTATNAVDLRVGADATNGFNGFWQDASDRVLVPAARASGDYGLLVLYDPRGVAVGAGASDELYLENASGGTAVTYRIWIIGTSA